jgi:hypothetical protein
LETVCRDYTPKGVKFYYIYKALAHPEMNGYVTPYSLAERLLHVKEAQRRLGSHFHWLCDTMANDIKHQLGNAPNSEFVIDPEGRIVRRRAWSDPDQLRKDLETLVGPVDHPTSPADLELETMPPPKLAPRGIVPRIEIPARMQPLQIKPQPAQMPFYAKLRAEADAPLLRTGQGKLYLEFRMDPIYRVHWNNLAAALHFELEVPDGMTVTPASGDGPKVDAPADIDPREFLLDVSAGDQPGPIRLTVRYFACNDDAGWCKAVVQQYDIFLQVDPDGGWVSRRRGRR